MDLSLQSKLFRKMQNVKQLLLSLSSHEVSSLLLSDFVKRYVDTHDDYVGPLYKIDFQLPTDKWAGIAQSQYALTYMKIILSVEQDIQRNCPLGAVMRDTLQKIELAFPDLYNMSIWSCDVQNVADFTCRSAIHNADNSVNVSFPFRLFVLTDMLRSAKHVAWFYRHDTIKCCTPLVHQQQIVGAVYCEIDKKEAPYFMCFLDIIASLLGHLLSLTTTSTDLVVVEKAAIEDRFEEYQRKTMGKPSLEEEQKMIDIAPPQMQEEVKKVSRETKSIVIKPTEAKPIETKVAEPALPSRTIIKRILQTQEAVLTEDAKGDYGDMAVSIVNQNIESAISAPIIKDGEVKGVIHLEEIRVNRGFRAKDLTLVNIVATKLAKFLDQVQQRQGEYFSQKKREEPQEQLEQSPQKPQVSLQQLREMASYVLQKIENKEFSSQQLDEILGDMNTQDCQNSYWSAIWKVSFFLVRFSQNPQHIVDDFIRDHRKVSPPLFEEFLGDEAMRPGPIERLVAQSAKLKKWIQATLGLKFIAIANIMDTLIEFFTSMIKNFFRSWKFAKSVQRHMERERLGNMAPAMANDWQRNRRLLSRYLRIAGFSPQNSQATFALELALDIRHNLDESIRDLSLLTATQRSSVAKKSLFEFIGGFIPNPFEVLWAWKDIFIVVFFMKYNREEVEHMYWQMVDSGRQIVSFLNEEQTKPVAVELQSYEYELQWRMAPQKTYSDLDECIEASRYHLQRLLQSIASSQLITPKSWTLLDLIREMKLNRSSNQVNPLCDVELEKRILCVLKPWMKTTDLQQLQLQLQDNLLFRERCKNVQQSASAFL
ncbi:GAF domain-containing protein [Candidatus Uabimicrobium amorphum]|uniref:GAF domain-containing protein n=1 Tax=Uabimicrobium amorphum TaxID=2596890 RepID=A0A5S9ISU6_UABAM|nr:GAF domain-containing protein [Candidatus Uabimicrobium amorphum]BBM86782.1 hypothetical protein UABAM_05170 [Candidatus Uabimicrobium amorphum]